ncbi:MAG TPA: FixH family protein [Thermoanaerobaculia bacterium]
MAKNGNQRLRIVSTLAVMALTLGGLTACSSVMTMIHGGAQKPASSEFGLGPRNSSAGLYTAVLQPTESLRPRKLQTVQVTLTDAKGQSVDGAVITIDGGMPQHGHGLPTQPRVTKALGNGEYVIEGVRFNMGGWWEFKLAIAGKEGADTVTFNLAL